MKNSIELSQVKHKGLLFRAVNYPQRKHYILQCGQTEARIIIQPNSNRAMRSFVALTFAILMYKAS